MEPEALATTAWNWTAGPGRPSRLRTSVMDKVMREGRQEASESDLKVLRRLENVTVRDFHSQQHKQNLIQLFTRLFKKKKR